MISEQTWPHIHCGEDCSIIGNSSIALRQYCNAKTFSLLVYMLLFEHNLLSIHSRQGSYLHKVYFKARRCTFREMQISLESARG